MYAQVLALTSMVFFTGTPQGKLPNLKPISPPPYETQFCNLNDDGLHFDVYVKNASVAAVPDTATVRVKVRFTASGRPDVVRAFSLAHGFRANQTRHKKVDRPPQIYFDPDLGFTITVDVRNAVTESNEGDNEVSDFCLG